MGDFSIDQNNLPGVKEVCRDFAVLEDHCLAHNLQEQEIESHLASNVHKSRLVQQDLHLAKRMQEEEDLRAIAESKRKHRHFERIDNEIAQEIQEQLVWQAEQQRQQEEKDEAIARKLQEREMKEERRRQKQLEANFEEDYYEDKAFRSPLDLREQHPGSTSPGYRKERYPDYSLARSPYNSLDPDRKRNGTRNRYPELGPIESGRSRHPERHPEIYSPERRPKYPEDYSKEKNKPLDLDSTEPRRRKKRDKLDEPRSARGDLDPVVRRKEKPFRDYSAGRDRVWDNERNWDTEREKDGQRTKERPRDRDQSRSHDRLFSEDVDRVNERHRSLDREVDRNDYGHRSRDRQRERGRDGNRERRKSRERSIERELDDYSLAPSKKTEDSLEWEDYKNRHRLPSGPNEVFEEPSFRGPSNEGQSPPRERGRKVRGEYGMREATHGLAQLDLQELELKDMEVARRLQEEEIKASQIDKRTNQLAEDEELARQLMEEEKREYKRSREKEKQAMERRQAEVEYKPVQEEVVRPRTREEVHSREDEYQRARNHKPAKPPTQHYENINPSYAYAESPYSPRPPSRPEAAYKGAYYRQ
ncbi:coiled-coil domain-containing protein 50-like isoform X1 [Myxocyprinus asiaticus]|uniref:coiled-coil domain-containing protein 50-like isoform X1 n=2 Tax=Myxocyprinus asiaticus TaxID=70543 RepID=UPI00222299D9|nr:coiled-coil domain-containing protein 50-like isoform X1 [Myxocyprinus asiaticus]